MLTVRIISGEGREKFAGVEAELVVIVAREELTMVKLDRVITKVEGIVHRVKVVVVLARDELTMVEVTSEVEEREREREIKRERGLVR